MPRSLRIAPLVALLCACAPRAPNVLLVTIDTLRADHLGSYGFALETSPSIDRLAAESVVFERAIAAAPSTGPSHASLMTSRYVREHSIGFKNGRTRLGGETTLAARFRAAGYATAAFVSNVNLRRRVGLDRGFDLYDDELPTAELNRPRQLERIAEQTTERARAWLEANRDRPFFLWVHYQDPHGPYAPPPGHVGRFRLPPDPGERALQVLADNSGRGGIPRYQVLEGLRLPSQYRSRYADEILYADRELGALLRAFDAHASGRGAVVLLTADHGESLGEREVYFAHAGGSTPELAHVPMLLRAPGLAPRRYAPVVSHVDVMPTLLELAGLAAPEDASGIALGPVLRGVQPLPDRVVYCDSGPELSAYRADSFVRAGKLEAAWDGDDALEAEWLAYDWEESSRWTRLDTSAALARVERDGVEIERYFRHPVPMLEAPPPGAEEVEALRHLGYVE